MTGDERPSFATLADWLEGRLDPPAAARVAAAVAAGDARTRASVEWLRGFLSLAAEMPLQQPPALVRHRLSDAYASWAARRGLAHPERQTLSATLVFDSRAELAAAGLRGGSEAETVHLAFAAGAADLVVDATPTADAQVRLSGQILGAELLPFAVAAALGPVGELATSEVDELGRFAFGQVPDTVTGVQLAAADSVIVAAINLRTG